MFSSFLTAATFVALSATGAVAGVVERQTATFSDVVKLHAVHGAIDLGVRVRLLSLLVGLTLVHAYSRWSSVLAVTQ